MVTCGMACDRERLTPTRLYFLEIKGSNGVILKIATLLQDKQKGAISEKHSYRRLVESDIECDGPISAELVRIFHQLIEEDILK